MPTDAKVYEGEHCPEWQIKCTACEGTSYVSIFKEPMDHYFIQNSPEYCPNCGAKVTSLDWGTWKEGK